MSKSLIHPCTVTDTMEPMYYGCLETNHKCPDFLYMIKHASFGTIAKSVNYAGILIFNWADVRLSPCYNQWLYRYIARAIAIICALAI